jgi:charged multivesicular body protein 3
MKLAGSIKSSTDVMKSMSSLMKLPELQRTMTEMSKEMMKMGIIEEMVEDTMDSVLDNDIDENVVDAEVEKVLFEITQGKLKDLPAVNNASLPGSKLQDHAAADYEDDDEPLEDMTKRLEALRS